MKHVLSFIILGLGLVTGCQKTPTDFKAIASMQDTSITALTIEKGAYRKALLIFPHADDEIVVNGLSMYLKSKGVELHLLTLCQHDSLRMEEWECSHQKQGMEGAETAGLLNNSWERIISDELIFWYDHEDSIYSIIKSQVTALSPEILITYDTEIGAYGHPEHRIAAEVAEQVATDMIRAGDTSLKLIFQSTLTKPLETFLCRPSPGYELAKKRTGSTGLPAPNVALDIRPFWPGKREAASCYQSQLNTLSKFYVFYEAEEAKEHNDAFSHEYYVMKTLRGTFSASKP
jgi:LmbE family N-acetylglucosaminyl deacetylase